LDIGKDKDGGTSMRKQCMDQHKDWKQTVKKPAAPKVPKDVTADYDACINKAKSPGAQESCKAQMEWDKGERASGRPGKGRLTDNLNQLLGYALLAVMCLSLLALIRLAVNMAMVWRTGEPASVLVARFGAVAIAVLLASSASGLGWMILYSGK
jgi:hypothetical protein